METLSRKLPTGACLVLLMIQQKTITRNDTVISLHHAEDFSNQILCLHGVFLAHLGGVIDVEAISKMTCSSIMKPDFAKTLKTMNLFNDPYTEDRIIHMFLQCCRRVKFEGPLVVQAILMKIHLSNFLGWHILNALDHEMPTFIFRQPRIFEDEDIDDLLKQLAEMRGSDEVARWPPYKKGPPQPITRDYVMKPDIKTFSEAYEEWYEGINNGPSIERLNEEFGDSWITENASEHYNRRKGLIDSIEMYSKEFCLHPKHLSELSDELLQDYEMSFEAIEAKFGEEDAHEKKGAASEFMHDVYRGFLTDRW